MDNTKTAIEQRLEFAADGITRYFQRRIAARRYPFLWVVNHCIDDALTDEMQADLGGKDAIGNRILAQCIPSGQVVTPAMVKRVLSEHRNLHMLGYGNLRQVSQRFTPDQIEGYRAELLTGDSVKRIDAACLWVERNLRYADCFNRKTTSYGLKHAAEPAIGYVTNGQFIVAMLLCEFRLGEPVQYNPNFNITHASVKRAWKLAGKRAVCPGRVTALRAMTTS